MNEQSKNVAKVQQAVNAYQNALKKDPKHLPTYFEFAKLLTQIGKNKELLKLWKMALQYHPNDYRLHYEIGIFFQKIKNYSDALKGFENALRINPKFYLASNAKGGIYYTMGAYEEALKAFEKTLEIQPDFYEVYTNLGAVFNKLKRYDAAKEILQKAIENIPKNAGAYTNLGNVYNNLGEFEKAKQNHLIAIGFESNNPLAYANLAIAQKNLAQSKSAIENFQKALTLDPRFVNAHFDLSTTLLSIGDFKKGFAEYEWRFAKEEMKGFIAQYKDIFSKPILTKNTNAYKKTVLIHSEQGFGDSIMFARFASQIEAKFGCYIIFKVRDELVRLFQNSFSYEVIGRSEKNPDFDLHLPIMSAPFVLEIDKEEQFGKESYLKETQEGFELLKEKKNIGICWSASKTGDSYTRKVFDIEYFKPLIQSDKYNIYSLEVGEAKEDIARCGFDNKIIDLSEKFTDFSKTASMVSELDLIITSDTSIAHLCGALGLKTWVILQKVPDWRWGLESEDSYLYDSVSLIRQKEYGNWQSAFDKLNERLGL